MKKLLLLIVPLALAGCDSDNWKPNWNMENPAATDDSIPVATTQDKAKSDDYLENKSAEPSVYLRDVAGVFEDYNLVLPNGNRIRVCSAYGCSHKQVYRLSSELLSKAKGHLSDGWSAEGERKGIGKALSVIEEEMGPATGTDRDKQGGALWGNGDSSQMNATDEALNATSILMVMFKYGLIRNHDLGKPEWKGPWNNKALYPILIDRSTGEKFGIDMGYRDHGGEIKIFPWSGDAP